MKLDLKKITEIIGESIETFIPFNKGLSNDNFLINNRYLVRLPKDFLQPFNSFKNEQNIENQLQNSTISISPIYINSKGLKISTFDSQLKSLEEQKITKNKIKKIAQLIKNFHQKNLKSEVSFDYLSRLSFYKEHSGKNLSKIEKKVVKSSMKWMSKSKYILCHNDLVAGNILSKNNKFYLIDFEYSAMNDPMFDLVSFLSENDIDDKELQTIFINEYFKGHLEDFDKDKFLDFFPMLDLLWYYWAEMMYQKVHNPIYQTIAKNKLKRLKTYKL